MKSTLNTSSIPNVGLFQKFCANIPNATDFRAQGTVKRSVAERGMIKVLPEKGLLSNEDWDLAEYLKHRDKPPIPSILRSIKIVIKFWVDGGASVSGHRIQSFYSTNYQQRFWYSLKQSNVGSKLSERVYERLRKTIYEAVCLKIGTLKVFDVDSEYFRQRKIDIFRIKRWSDGKAVTL